MDVLERSKSLGNAQAKIYAGEFSSALEISTLLLENKPDDVEALYIQAVSYRYLNGLDGADAALARIKDIAPDFGRAYQEEGYLLLAQKKPDKALKSFQQACTANPALVSSWRAQAELLEFMGLKTEAWEATAQAERIAALPKELQTVSNFIHEGKLLKAEDLCRRFLKVNPKYTEAMRLLADIGFRLGAYNDSEFLLESALLLEPTNIQLRLDYIAVLRRQQKFAQALDEAKLLLKWEPKNPIFQSHFAIECLQANKLGVALEMFEKVLKKLPDDPATLTSRGHVLKTIGRREEAISSYRRAYQVDPEHSEAYHALANLKTYSFTDDELAAMLKEVEKPQLYHGKRIQLCFALGKAFEDEADFPRAFKYYEQGNRLKKLQSRYSISQMDEEFEAQKKTCTQDLFAKHIGSGYQARDPIFIVGLPRSGSTLLEQILASHSQVEGTLELPNIIAMSHKLRGHKKIAAKGGYPQILADMEVDQFFDLGAAYIEETRMHRNGAPYFVDKMPNNFRHIGLIHLILPNAKIIDARRDPMACCFSGFKQLFAEGQEFTYGLSEIGQYYRGYVGLMEHWDTVLPGKVLRVQYEDVVDDVEAQVRRILDFCGLAFDPACLEFYEADRSVRTASSEQVRQPIYKSALDYWHNFEPFLGPLKKALGEG